MTDNVTIATGISPGTTQMASDEILGVQHQRVKVGVGEDGTAVDVSATNPMPAGQYVANATNPAVNDKLRGTATNGGGNPPQTVAASVPHSYLPAPTGGNPFVVPVYTASAMGDTQTGNQFPPAGLMAWDGTAWRRGRIDPDTGGLRVTPTGAPAQTTDVQAVRDRLPAALDTGGVKVTPTGTVPVSGPATDAQLRATPLVVDTEFSGASSTGARAATATTLAATSHMFDDPGSSPAAAPVRTARMLTDAESGLNFPGGAPMLWSGTAWSRARTSTTAPTSLLASAERAGAQTFAFPSFVTFDCPAVLVMFHCTGVGTGNVYVTVKSIGSNATLARLNITPASVNSAGPGAPVDCCLLLGAAAPFGGAIQANENVAAAVRFGVTGFPIPAPGQITGYTQHTDASAWTYSLDYHLIA